MKEQEQTKKTKLWQEHKGENSMAKKTRHEYDGKTGNGQKQ